ncbi:MAG: protease pro-enzyme activation domain-containing protein [Chthoniobacterales bacterium]
MKLSSRNRFGGISLFVATVTILQLSQIAYGGRLINGHVPAAARRLLPLSDAPANQPLQLAVGLAVRDPAAVDAFVKEVSDPASPNFRKYLTPEEFTDRFGPSEEEYQSVIDFLQAQGLSVTQTHPNRLVVDVAASVAQVQRAFHVRIRNFAHPTEGRTFFAPENEPEVDSPVPILHIAGLSNYWIPRPQSRERPLGVSSANASPRVGSGPSGAFAGNDFRNAYLSGVTLTGAGQNLGLLEFDGYNANDILAYRLTTNVPNVPLQNVLVGGYSGRAGSGNGEVCLDIELAMSMAPGLSQIIVYEAPNSSPWEDVLNRIATDNQAKQVSCSWGGGPPSATAEQIFQQMAAQGQTFFNASGDDDAFTGDIPFPTDSPNVIQVGGTSLTTLYAGGPWAYEAAWNWGLNGGSYTGSGGGISSVYSIPTWQQTVSMLSNQGSTTFRNIPDVALTADNIFSISNNGRTGNIGGTSCAAPLWAAFTALVNQQAASDGKPPVGYLNPALYAVAQSANYSVAFHDIIAGDNITPRSSGKFQTAVGYDLCTGWGTPTGALISALLSPGAPITVYNVTVAAIPINGGTVIGAGTYLAGAQATVTATPFNAYLFTNWTEDGTVVSTSPTYTFTAGADRNLVANFAVNNSFYTVTVSASPSTEGNVGGGGSFRAGSHAFVFAGPKRKYVFVDWKEDGVVVSTAANYGFTVDKSRNLVAEFSNKKARGRHR